MGPAGETYFSVNSCVVSCYVYVQMILFDVANFSVKSNNDVTIFSEKWTVTSTYVLLEFKHGSLPWFLLFSPAVLAFNW